MNFITERDLVETAEFAWTTRVRGSRRLRCGCGGSLTCGSLGGGGRGSIFEILGTLGTGSFFVIDVTDEAVTSKKYILRYTRRKKKIIVYNKMNPLKENSPIIYRTKCESNTRDSRNSIPYTSITFHYW